MSSGPTVSHREFTVPGEVPIHGAIHPGAGPAAVLIHGISAAGDIWFPVVEELGNHVTPVTIDLRDHGASGKPERGYLYDEYIGDLERVLDYLGLERPLIVGHSLGGLIALWWAARHPDRAAALVIEDSPLRSGEDFRDAFDNWIHLNSLPKHELRAWYAEQYPDWTPDRLDWRAETMSNVARGVFTELKADSLAHQGVDRIAEIEGITSPVLFIHGDLEAGGMVQPEDIDSFERRLANATMARVPGAGHNIHTTRGHEFLALAVPFLEQHTAGASHVRLPD